MNLQIRPFEGQLWVISPVGRLDARQTPALEHALGDLLDRGHTRIVVDLSQTTYMASGGLKALLVAVRRARAVGGEVRLAAPGDRLLELLAMTGFDRLIAVDTTVEQAAGQLKGK